MTIASLRLVLGDQLSPALSSLRDADPAHDQILMAEVMQEASYVPHHPQKIAFIFAAMRHFAEDLRSRGFTVHYTRLDDPANSGSLFGEAQRFVTLLQAPRLVLTEPAEWRLDHAMRRWGDEINLPVEVRQDDRFLCSRAAFARWAEGKRQLRMEFFYRAMRRRHQVLLDAAGEPEGGQWNFDAENRKALPKGLVIPERPAPDLDAITRNVLDLVRTRFPHHYGQLEPFRWAVTRAEAEAALDWFIAHALPDFGDYQDAMATEEPLLFHSVLSPYINVGLLDPLQVIRAAETAYRQGRVKLNAAEGFIRQILGWREYVHGLYWLEMPGYGESNALDAERPLPEFFWTGETGMNCLRHAIGDTLRQAYAHHIQRLMVIGNFALLAELAPKQVQAWYLAVYADAFEWVELPNTHGMALFADGGRMASKPYASSGKYIQRQSDYCRGCTYDVAQSTGPRACPFNALYWDFLARNQGKLAGNPRLAMPYRNWARFSAERQADLRARAAQCLNKIDRL
ncbi:cryptochrome/photolyase family protein [Ferrovibrio sp.]|uniref:cryptochrome/photolyase family protein n=1 Tax=Ferrovibrio sp. TaxID=1917215 RepID=UPI003D27401B